MNSNDVCKNCGGDKAIHHYKTNQCPVGGREAPIGRKQEWKSTTFEAENNELAALRAELEIAKIALLTIKNNASGNPYIYNLAYDALKALK